MAAKPQSAPSTIDREIVHSREFDAPRELVFQAWTAPGHVAQWFGPAGFTITTHEMNVTPGGRWRFTMHGPDGTDYPNRIVYEEVVAPERLVYWHDSDIDGDPNAFHVTATFAAKANRTLLTMRAVFKTAARRDFVVREFRAIEGGRETLARLAEYVAQQVSRG